MKFIKKIIVFILIIYVFSISNVFASTGIVNTDAVRLREKPSTDSNIITNIYQGEEMEILETEGDWLKVKYGGNTGYVKKEYIKESDNSKLQTNSNTTNTTNTNTNSVSQENVATNTNVNNTTNTNTNTNTSSTNTNSVSNENTNTTSDSQNVYVMANETYIRFLPNMSSNKIVNVEKNKEITKISEIANWTKISIENGTEGWVPSSKITIKEKKESGKEEPEQPEQKVDSQENKTEETEQSKETDVGKTGKINVETAIVREKANQSSEAIDSLDYDDVVKIVGEEGDWYQITSGDIKGYVNKRLITINVSSRSSSEPRETPIETQENDETTISKEQNEILSKALQSTTNTGNEIVEFAKQYLGLPYVSGGKSPSTGFDCSGFTQYVYGNFGYSIGASAATQNSAGSDVAMQDLKPGDLILFYDEGKTKIGHTGIYIGDGNFIHAANADRGVVTDNLNTSTYYNSRFVNAKRLAE